MSGPPQPKRAAGPELPTTFELRQLEHALAVAEHGSFATAALALHLSQSALSRSVQALERVVGSSMFVRSPQGVEVTEAGQALLHRAREIVALARDMDTQFFRNRSLRGGSLGVGLASPFGEGCALAATRLMAVEWPGVRVELRTAFRTDLLPQLRGGQIELLLADASLLGMEPEEEIELETLQSHALVAFVRRGHPLVGRQATLGDVFGHPVLAMGRISPGLLEQLLREQAAAGPPAPQQRPFPSVICNSMTMLERLLLGSDAVASAPPSSLRHLVERGAAVPLLAPAWLRSPFGVARLRSRPSSDPVRAFLAELRRAHARAAAEDAALIERWFGAGPGARR